MSLKLGKQIPKKEFNKWIRALRSGKYKQSTEGWLQDKDGFCCLGVACKVINKDYKVEPKEPDDIFIATSKAGLLKGSMPSKSDGAPTWLVKINNDFTDKTGEELIVMNDGGQFTFDEIADALEITYKYGWK